MTVGEPRTQAPGAIDALAPLRDGRYVDGLVTVYTEGGVLPRQDLGVVRTEHFDVWTDRGLVVRHRVPDGQIDNSLTSLLESELFRPGWVSGSQFFERLFTGVVRTSRPEAVDAWTLFYRNSRTQLARARTPSADPDPVVADFAAIYEHADRLVPELASVLEVGSCFGFLALHLARVSTRRVVASDVSSGSMRLLSAISNRLALPVETLVADAARIPRPDRSLDVVLVPHLLEHLADAHGLQVLHEAMRVASHRVVVAVPFEDEANATYGHVRTLERSDLEAWGAQAEGWSWSVEEHRGGWLVLDRRPEDPQMSPRLLAV